MALAVGLLPCLSESQYTQLVQQLQSGKQRVVRFSSALRAAGAPSAKAHDRAVNLARNGCVGQDELDASMGNCSLTDSNGTHTEPLRGDDSGGGASSAPSRKATELQVMVEMELCHMAPARAPVCIYSGTVDPCDREQSLVLVHFSPVPDRPEADRVAQLEAQVRMLQEHYTYVMDLLPGIACTKDALVSNNTRVPTAAVRLQDRLVSFLATLENAG